MRMNLPDGIQGVFTTSDASRAGLTRSAVEHAVRSGRAIRLQRGVYVAADRWEVGGIEGARQRFLVQSIATTLAVRAAVPSHVSAAVLAALPIWQLPERACATVPPRYTGDARRLHLHRARLDADDVVPDVAIPRTRVARTIVDIAREHGVEDAVVAGDQAIRRRMLTGDAIHRVLAACAGWPGMRRASALPTMLDGRSESPLESVSRLRLVTSGCPTPELQTDIVDLDGVFLGRLDMYWDEFGVAGEIDGREKYRGRDGDEVRWKEKVRQDRMDERGIIFVRWGRADLEDMPRLAARLESAFVRGQRRPRADRGWRALPREYTLDGPNHVY